MTSRREAGHPVGARHAESAGRGRAALDLMVGVGDPASRDLDISNLGEVRPVLVVRRDGRRLPRGAIAVSHLKKREWVGYGPTDDPFFAAVWRFLDEHGLAARLRTVVPHIQTLKALVAAGAGATILPGLHRGRARVAGA